MTNPSGLIKKIKNSIAVLLPFLIFKISCDRSLPENALLQVQVSGWLGFKLYWEFVVVFIYSFIQHKVDYILQYQQHFFLIIFM
jgi:hypothetical protein